MTHDPADKNILSFVQQVSGDEFLKVEEDLGEGFVRLRTSEAERRQAKHDIRWMEDVIVELLRNARDAGAHRIFVATTSDGSTRSLTVIDDGSGIPTALESLIFEPRVTSKLETMVVDDWGVHGRGMALFSISQNVISCRLVATEPKGGSAFALKIDTATLRERTDQSRWPHCVSARDELVVESGPRNLIRNCVEFALAHPHIEVFLGSPSDILATLTRIGLDPEQLTAVSHAARTAVWRRPALCVEADELKECGQGIGLEVSLRNCYRIINNEIGPLTPVADRVRAAVAPKERTSDIYKDARGLKVAATDIAAFQNELEQAFDDLASKYFLTLHDDVKVKIGKDSIRATFNFDKDV